MSEIKCVLAILAIVLSLPVLRGASQEGSAPPKTQDATPKKAANFSPASDLDFEIYRSQIEPIFLKRREDGVTCYSCHSVLQTRMKLQPLEAGRDQWTEAQSRQNFDVVAELVVAGKPTESHFLLHPLAHEAGGDPQHTGGKFWKTQDDPEWKMIAAWVLKAPPAAEGAARSASQPNLDYEFFKQRVQPVFLEFRTGHARCYACHTETNNNFRLQKLSDGNSTWTEAQSRLNFEAASQHVTPGDPSTSRLLLHPLAPEAGGDPFHSGGRQFFSKMDPSWVALSDWVQGANAQPVPLKNRAGTRQPTALIYLVNNAADSVEAIDPETNTIVQIISRIDVPHGVNISRDGARLFFSSESEQTLVVVDRKTECVLARIPLSGRPNNIAATKDKGQILVGIRSAPGAVDVISTESLKVIKTIPMKGEVHNIFLTPDGKYAVAGSIEGKTATVIDIHTLEPVWDLKFDHGVRPMAFETAADGSTSRIFVQLSGYNGFAVVNFAKHAEIDRIALPDSPRGFAALAGRTAVPAHGIGTQPGEKKLWVASTEANAVFAYSLPDLHLLGHADLPQTRRPDNSVLGSVPEWIAFSLDGKTMYVTDSALMLVSVIDTETMKEIAEIPVGQVPKRIYTLLLDSSSK
jgi:YVTN family beta-propeller protein